MENTEIKAVEAVEEIAEEAVATKSGNFKYVAAGSLATIVVLGAVKYGKKAFKAIKAKLKKSDEAESEVAEATDTDVEG
jgi:hypothetical protein